MNNFTPNTHMQEEECGVSRGRMAGILRYIVDAENVHNPTKMMETIVTNTA